VVIATGAVPQSELPGSDGANVVSCLDVMDAKVEPGQRVAILGTKGVAISTALYLIEKGGHDITLVHAGKKPGPDVNPSYIWRYMTKLKEGKVVRVARAKPKEITQKGIVAITPEGEQLIEADTVVLADMEPVTPLETTRKTLAHTVKGLHVIGDALLPRRGNSAILDGYKMGMRL
jgi:pyruvate/2-oxoglutarate dehydrogenase complex dihydrolipoamide dehydrogenase (E3) component